MQTKKSFDPVKSFFFLKKEGSMMMAFARRTQIKVKYCVSCSDHV